MKRKKGTRETVKAESGVEKLDKEEGWYSDSG